MANAIEIENLGKRYRLGEFSHGYTTLRDKIAARFSAARRRHTMPDYIWALRDVNLAIEQGEVVGVIGRNGAGKTTLLKLLARITEPTVGVARTRGHLGALLEVGTGFHPELTGRENVYLNGALLGLTRRQINRRFDEIVAFADLERFLDTPLKRYSAGMQLRLAFAVAAHVEPDVVVVDEVLAVGDLEFQRRCLGRMSELGHQGRTAVFVSHDLGAIARLCTRVIWLDQGRVVEDGPPGTVIEQYQRAAGARIPRVTFAPDPAARVALREVALASQDESGESEHLRRDLPLRVGLRFDVRERTRQLDVSIQLIDQRGVSVLWDCWKDHTDGAPLAEAAGSYEAYAVIPPVLTAGDYTLRVWIDAEVGPLQFDIYVDVEAITFTLWPAPSEVRDSVVRDRVVAPRLEWGIDELTHAVEASTAR